MILSSNKNDCRTKHLVLLEKALNAFRTFVHFVQLNLNR
jgi:hypothetical protein